MNPARILVLLLILISALAASADPMPNLAAEATEWDVDGLELLLPHHETTAERLFWQAHADQMPSRTFLNDTPPVVPVRNCAEWEPSTGVLIRYPLGLPYNLLRDFDDDVTIYVVVSSSYQSSAQSALNANGVDMSKVEWVVRNNDSIWTRDYGPWFVFDGLGQIGIIDHTYNRPWRPNDNLIPVYVAQQLGIPSYSHDMYHTGGNYMTDGAHVSCSTRLVYNEAASENGMNQAQVDQLMLDYYGVQTYHVLDYIESGGIHHIDTWAKFLDEETVLVKDVWSSHWTYNALNQRATLLASLPASTGRNYQVHRLYCYDIGGSSPASYTNSLILNDDIYVPTFGNSTHDNAAIAAYQAAAPGYSVRGYYYSGFISDDALHCRTKGMMDAGMLRVAHVPILEDQALAPVTVTAEVQAYSEADLTEVKVVYRHDGGAWQDSPMAAGGGWQYEATIPAPAVGAMCEYYVTATDATGRTEGYPRVAPARLIAFQHGLDLTPVREFPATAVALHANHPNPFNPATTFSFALHHPEHAELVVLDVRGRVVRTLVDRECPAGTTEVVWNGTDNGGRRVPSGAYIYRLRAAGLEYTGAATLVK